MNIAGKTIAAFALGLIANELFEGSRDVELELTPADDMAVNATNGNSATELTAANVPKNPGISVNTSNLPYSMHRRQSFTYAEIEYSSAGRIVKNGNKHCSGNAIVLDEYETVPESGVLVSSAAHCFENRKASDQYTFVLDFMDENNVLNTFTFTEPEIWSNPRKEADVPQSHIDQALMFFAGDSLPDEITPARLEIYSEHLVEDFYEDHFKDINITAAGYSKDIFGLSRDTDCRIKTVLTFSDKSPYLKTTCQMYHGGSGSGLIFENFENENPDQKTIGAITATIAKDTDFTDRRFHSYYTLFFHHNLAEVPFLQRKDICARVGADGNRNMHYDHTYNEATTSYTTLPFNEVVYVTDMLYDEQEQYGPDDVWLQIRRFNNPDPQTPDGYVNSAALQEVPCPAAP